MAKAIFDQRYRDVIASLIAARLRMNVSQQWVADRIGMSQQIFSRIEQGQRPLSVLEYIDIARVLGLDPGELVSQIPLSNNLPLAD